MKTRVINILSATQIGKYPIRSSFDDQTTQGIDIGPILVQPLSQSQHPEIRHYLDEARFNAFRLEYGERVWGENDLCIPIMDQYNNQTEKHAS